MQEKALRNAVNPVVAMKLKFALRQLKYFTVSAIY